MLHCSKSGMVGVMRQYNTPLNMSPDTTAELIRVNYFVVREDAASRDNQSVKALEEALDQRENASTATPLQTWFV